MAQQPVEIRAHIKAEGDSLREDLEEIQTRVKEALDWRIWYRKNTALAIGSVAAGGLLVSLLLPKSRSIESKFMSMEEIDGTGIEPDSRVEPRTRSNSGSRFHEVVDNTTAAVVGVAADWLQDLMSKPFPRFREHYSEAQRRRFE